MAVTTQAQTRVYEQTVFFDRLRKYLFLAMLAFWAVLSVAPLYFTLVFSFKPVADIYTPPIWAPIPFTLENYQTILGTFQLFPRWVWNSVFISVIITIFRVLFCAMAGYAFARIEFPLKNFWFNLLLISMMMPGVVTLIPSFLIIGPGLIRGGIDLGMFKLPTGFGLIDNPWG